MTLRPLLGVSLLVAACGSSNEALDAGADAGPQADAGSALEQEVLAAHNAVRASAMPAPSPALPALSWSPAAEAAARAWVDQCQFAHNPNLPNNTGENIYASTATQTTATAVIDSWAAEASDYTLSTNSCASGQVCGHYTQLVWRATTSVGCAFKYCSTGSPFSGSGTWLYWVCDYQPAGNVVGQKPY